MYMSVVTISHDVMDHVTMWISILLLSSFSPLWLYPYLSVTLAIDLDLLIRDWCSFMTHIPVTYYITSLRNYHDATYYSKNKWVVYPCQEIQGNYFCVGIFYESEGWMKYPYTKHWTWSHHELILVFMQYYFCFDDINV